MIHRAAALRVAVLLSLITAPRAFGGVNYTVTDLSTLGGAASAAYDINSSGQVVGWANTSEGTQHAFLYSGSGPLQDLGTLPGTFNSVARGINDLGHIVGSSHYYDYSHPATVGDHAFLYSSGALRDLGTLPGKDFSCAFGINNAGQVVGYASVAADPVREQVFLSAGTEPIQGLSWAGYPSQINNAGMIVGTALFGNALIWNSSTGSTQYLWGGEGLGINDRGETVGWSGSPRQAVYYDGTSTHGLGALSAGGMSYANCINNNAQIVGFSGGPYGEAPHAVLWNGAGPIQDLNSLIDPSSGWVLTIAYALNDKGQIVGEGTHNGVTRAFLLNPTGSQCAWNGVVGTSWANAGNWDGGSVPGATDDVILSAAGTARQIASLGGGQSARSLTFNAHASAPITIAAGNTLTLGSGGIALTADTAASHTINADVALAVPQTWTVPATRTLNAGGSISGSGPLTKAGNGTLVVTGAATPTGGVVVQAGTLQIGNGGASGSLASDIVNNAAVVFNRSDNLTYSGAISGTGTVTKTGSGTLTLAGTHSYTGPTNVQTGTLRLNGALAAASPVTVQSGATLAGAGTAGAVTVHPGGHVAPGDYGTGVLNVASLTLGSGSVLDYYFSATSQADQSWQTGLIKLAAGGQLELNGASVRLHSATNPSDLGARIRPGAYRLIEHNGTVSGTGGVGITVANSNKGLTYRVYPEANAVTLYVSAWHPDNPGRWIATAATPTARLREWTGSEWTSVPEGSVSGKVHVLVHGWQPGQRDWVATHGGDIARFWDCDNFGGFSDLAKAIKAEDGARRVLVYSWIDGSATRAVLDGFGTAVVESSRSQDNAIEAGNGLARELRAALGLNTPDLQLIGHSHGARVVVRATERLLYDGSPIMPKQLTLLDSPESLASQAIFAANTLGRKLATLPLEIYIDNYFSRFGGVYPTVDVNVDLNAHSINPSTAHGYPIGWYARSANSALNQHGVGIDWSPLTQNGGQFSANLEQLWSGVIGQPDEFDLVPVTVGSGAPVTAAGATLNTVGTVNAVAVADDVIVNGAMQLTQGSPAYWHSTFDTSSNDVLMQFTYRFTQPGEGDQLGIWVDGDLRFLVAGEDVGTVVQTDAFDIGDLAPGMHIMTVALHDYGGAPAQFTIGDFQVVSVPEPSAVALLAAAAGCALVWRARRRRG